MDKHLSDTEPLIFDRLIVFVFKRLSSLFFPFACWEKKTSALWKILIMTLKLMPGLKSPSI